jgi:hypothetical protein
MVGTRAVRPRLAAIAALPLVSLFVLQATAHAEPTSWLAFGPGLSANYDRSSHGEAGGLTVSAEIGLGTDPSHPLVVGGVFRALTTFGVAPDRLPLSLSARIATSGFARGDLGVAMDLGVAARWTGGQTYGHFPFQPVAILGLPGALQLEVGFDLGDVTGASPAAAGGFFLVSVDFFRLASRRSGTQKGFFSSEAPPPVTVTFHDLAPAAPPTPP